jgi:hypothetical protein
MQRFQKIRVSLSEKQVPRFVGNVSSCQRWIERLESSLMLCK